MDDDDETRATPASALAASQGVDTPAQPTAAAASAVAVAAAGAVVGGAADVIVPDPLLVRVICDSVV
jgi:hypothetical protein